MREELEEVELLSQDAMVALLRLLHLVQVRVELLLLEEGGRIDALQHLPSLVAAPIRAGGREQLEVLEIRRVRDVRPSTEVGEGAVRVRRDDLVRSLEVLEALELEWIVGEDGLRLRL